MGMALALICVVETNPIRVSWCCMVGVLYVNVPVLRNLKEELAWVVDKRFLVITRMKPF